MGWLTKQKKEKQEVPEVTTDPRVAYVSRTKPERVGRVQVAGKLKGNFDGWFAIDQLEEMITDQFGGGTFRCKIFDSGDKTKYLGCHTFTAPGEPMVDGEPIQQPEPGSSGGGRNKIEDKIEEERLKAELEQQRIENEKKLRELRGDEDEDDENSGPSFQMPQENDEIKTLKEEIARMREEAAEERRRHEREIAEEKHRRELQELRDQFTNQLAELKSAINGNSGKEAENAVAAQMKSTEAMIAAMNQQTQTMLTSQSELTKVLLNQASKSDSGERTDRLMEKLLDAKAGQSSEVMNAMKEAYNTGIQMARGAEQSPTTLPDVLKELSGKALETVDNYMHARGQGASEALKSEINAAVGKAVNHIGQQIAPLLQRGAHAPAGGIPAGEAARTLPSPNPAPAQPAPAQQNQPTGQAQPMTREQLRDIVDQVLKQFLADAPTASKNWIKIAQERIPADILAEVGDFSFDNLIAFAYKYGSEDVVTEVMVSLAEMGANTPEQVEQVQQVAQQMRANMAARGNDGGVGAIVSEPGTPVSAPSVADDGLFADEGEEDGSLDLTSPQERGGVAEGAEAPHPDAGQPEGEGNTATAVANPPSIPKPVRIKAKSKKKKAKKN